MFWNRERKAHRKNPTHPAQGKGREDGGSKWGLGGRTPIFWLLARGAGFITTETVCLAASLRHFLLRKVRGIHRNEMSFSSILSHPQDELWLVCPPQCKLQKRGLGQRKDHREARPQKNHPTSSFPGGWPGLLFSLKAARMPLILGKWTRGP